MIKEFFIKQLIKRKLGNLPPEMQERMAKAIDKDPEFFSNLSKEIEREIKNGKTETVAAISVMKKHQARFRELLGN
jgi:plasmid maintenance system antidote protein VapI